MVLEKEIETSPAILLESPKLGFKLPVVFTEKEVEDLINSFDLSGPEGERNKAIVEMLYGCGLRVSELIGLRISYLHLNEDIIRMISAKKREPEWLLEWRLKAFRHWQTMTEPAWANVH